MRLAVSFLGAEVLAVEFGADRPSEPDSDTVRYDPTSTTACQTETVYSGDSVVVCGSPFGFRVDRP